MRKLTKKQKSVITRYVESGCFVLSCDEIESSILESVVNLNDYETIYQDIDRFINDLKFS